MPSDRPGPTHRVITDLMRNLSQGDCDTASDILAGKGADLGGICALLEKSRLSGYFYSLIVNTALTEFFPAASLQELADSYQRQVERNRNNLALLVDIQKHLGDASIPFLTMKGPYLAQRFFGDLSRRFMSDIDILVRGEDLETAIVAVEAAGLHPPSGVKFDPRNPFWGIHAVELRGEAGTLDIHHAIRNLPKISFDYEKIWRDAREFTIGNETFTTLCDTDTLLIAAIGLGADIQTSHHNLRKIWDIYMMLRQMDTVTDWRAFFAERDREGSLKLVLNMFSFCLLLLGTEQDCPNLGRAMSSHSRLVLIASERQAEAIFARDKQHIANRMLFSRLLPVSVLHYWLGWMVTVPVRVWHYRRTRRRK